MYRLFVIFLGIILCLGSTACHVPRETQLPRAAPGYVRWMEKQSMRSRVPELLAQVSQTERVWLHSGEGGHVKDLLRAAPTWISMNAHHPASRSPLFQRILPLVPELSAMGLHGVYLGPLGERLDIWVEDGHGKDPYGAAAASLTFDQAAGTEEQYAALAAKAEEHRIQLGADLPPAATGAGPDFLLQARNAIGHAGLYAMLPAPVEIWDKLPQAGKEWDFLAISPETEKALADAGILPIRMRRDNFSWTPPGGWAVTGPVQGSDGQIRRWLYRYEGSPDTPVLLWHDPFEQARRLYTAAVIRQTGLLGQTLAGVRVEAWFGLEPDTQKATAGSAPSFAPGLEALNDICRQVHRYGGWAMQADALPLEAVSAVLEGPCDFCRDDVVFMALAEAFIKKDGSSLAKFFRELQRKNLDLSRLAHGYNTAPDIMAPSLSAASASPNTGMTIPWGDLDAEDLAKLRKMFFVWKMGLPGLAFISSSILSHPENEFLSGEVMDIGEDEIRALLLNRHHYGAALGKLVSIMERGSVLGLLFQLDKGTYWLIAANFSDKKSVLEMELPDKPAIVFDAMANKDSFSLPAGEGQKYPLPLDGQQARNVVFKMNLAK